MCLTRPLLARLAAHPEPDTAPEVSRDGLQQSFAAYSDALRSLWDGNPLAELLGTPTRPVTVVLADDDGTVLPSDVLDVPPAADGHVLRVAGDHGIAFHRPDLLRELLVEQLPSTTRGAVHERR